jgi:hypothetical protein
MGNYGGVYVSYDDGLTWELLESGLGKDHMKQINLSPDEYLYTISGLTTSTIHKSVNPTVGITQEKIAIKPITYNYPNPFNGETCIYFSLPSDANENLFLNIFDLAGNIVVDDKVQVSPQNINQIRFNSDGLAPGIYIFEIICGTIRCSNKMIIN